MTREIKLSLILGFCAVVFVGLLVSDHYSKARASKFAGEIATRTPEPSMVQPDHAAIDSVDVGPLRPATAETTRLAPVTNLTTIDSPLTASSTPHDTRMPVGNGFTPAAGTDTGPSPIPGFSSVPTPQSDPTSGKPFSAGKEYKHPVAKGENLQLIAQKYYGDSALSKPLGEYNKTRLNNKGQVQQGVTLRVPPRDVLMGQAVLMPENITAQPAAPNVHAGGSPVMADPAAPVPSVLGVGVKPIPGGKVSPPGAPEGTTPPGTKPADKNADKPGTYTVGKGDSLMTISQKLYGTTKRWKEILDLNRKQLDDDEAALRVGMVLKVPAKK